MSGNLSLAKIPVPEVSVLVQHVTGTIVAAHAGAPLASDDSNDEIRFLGILWLASACRGHGFKHSAADGE